MESITEELRSMEPIFHTTSFGCTQAEHARRTVEDFWEVGASGRSYDRATILAMDASQFVNADEAGWRGMDFDVRELGGGNYLATYRLDQQGRKTRRATLWQKAGKEWKIVYHQGTLVEAADEKK